MEDQKPVRTSFIPKEDRKIAEKRFIREFLELYRDLPALWDVNSKLYSNRSIKAEQYRILTTKYQERYPTADKEEVTKKINSLRTNFRKELKRVREAIESGSNPDDAVPNLWYFEEMSFLANQETPRGSILKKNVSQDNEDIKNEEETPTSSKANKSIKLLKKGAFRQETRKRRISDHVEPSPHCPLPIATMAPRPQQQQQQQQPDECDKIVSVWADELRKMDPQQQLFAKKAINDILFEGQMGTLHRNSVEINVGNMVFASSMHSACMSPPNSSQ